MASHISLILLEDVENLGLAGEEVHVAPGYARNFLIPRGLAAKATPGTLRQLAARKEKIEAKRAADLAAAKETAAKLADFEVVITAQAAADGQLFGSVSARIIADKLAEAGYPVGHNHVFLDAPIKLLGKYNVRVRLHADVEIEVKVKVDRI